MKLEVRCCCDVMKLMGWIPVPYEERDLPGLLRIALPAEASDSCAAEKVRLIALFIARFAYGDGRRVLGVQRAIKADGIPLETLRLIMGFIEATPKNIAIEIKLKMLELVRDNRHVAEIRVHPSIMMELQLIPFLESRVRIGAGGCTFDGVPLVPDAEVMSFSVVPECAYAAGSLKGTTTGCR